ncbi:MAG: hypothetical protein ABWY14_03960 [Tardiphaga sp.]
MSKARFLREQANRAERLARGALDNLTIERLTALSIEYRQTADLLELTPELALAVEPLIGELH